MSNQSWSGPIRRGRESASPSASSGSNGNGRGIRKGKGKNKGDNPSQTWAQTRLVPLDPPRPALRVLGLARPDAHEEAQALAGGDTEQRHSRDTDDELNDFMDFIDIGSDSTGMVRFENSDLDGPPPDVCVACFYMARRRKVPVEPTVFDDFVRLINDHAGQVDPHVHASMIHSYYTQNIYEPFRTKENPFPDWPFPKVLEHLTQHILDPNITMANNIADIKRMMKLLKDTMVIENIAEGRNIVNLDAIKAYERLVKLQLSIYKTKTAEMNFRAMLEPAIAQGTKFSNLRG